MNLLTLTTLLLATSAAAGFLGSLTGLGGGVVLVPVLTLLFHVHLRYAIGASLVSVIATSSGSAAAYVAEGISNIRVAMFLEVATTLGAILGAFLAGFVSTGFIAFVFGCVLILSAALSVRQVDHPQVDPDHESKLANFLQLRGEYRQRNGEVRQYEAERPLGGFGVMLVAGGLSGLLGIGSGAVKVIAMDHVMKLPFKVSTTTSNFMIGVTAAASAGIYLRRGYIDPGLAMPVMLGVLGGSMAGAKLLVKAKTQALRVVFGATIGLLGLEMIYQGVRGL